MAKLDPEIEHLIQNSLQIDADPTTLSAGRSAKPDSIVYISIQFEGDIAEIQKTGFDTGTVIGNIAYGATTLQNLVRLSVHPQVKAIEKQRKKHLLLNKSIPNIKANQVWSRSGDSFSGYTGKDVVIGIVDTGIDFRHENFRKADSGKTTRILKIWDQTLQAGTDGTAPGPITNASIGAATLGYGVEYNSSQINDSMGSSGPVKHVDEHSHGTHVAGIAAGDGSQSGGCHLSYYYVGVAPDADLIIVRMFGLSASDRTSTSPPSGNHMMNAIMYIMNEAKKINKPVSINLSLGSFTATMDGTSSDSQAIDTLLTNNSTGTSIIFAAGNEGASDFHAKGDVPAGNTEKLDLRFKVSPNDTKVRYLVIVYTGSNLQIRLTSPVGGTNGQINWVTQAAGSGSSATANGTGGNVSVSNNVNRIRITISPPANGNNIAGDWKIELQDTGSTETSFDAFCLYGSTHDRKSVYFLDHVTVQSTLSEEATTKEVVSVGSYKVDGGALAPSSGRGMTLDLRLKPEIAAPGVGINSTAIPAERINDNICKRCCCDCCNDFYVVKGGTSMAAPHVAGVVALMMQKNKNLTHTTYKNHLLTGNQGKPSGLSLDDDLGWGVGRLDAKGALDLVSEASPPPPTPPTPPVPFSAIPPDHFGMLQERFLSTNRGPEFFRLFKNYFEELRILINTNRRVATVWHRSKGPAWIRAGFRAASQPEDPIPYEMDGLTLQTAISKMAAILKKYASQAFINELEKYGPELKQVDKGMNVLDLIDMLGEKQIVSAT